MARRIYGLALAVMVVVFGGCSRSTTAPTRETVSTAHPRADAALRDTVSRNPASTYDTGWPTTDVDTLGEGDGGGGFIGGGRR